MLYIVFGVPIDLDLFRACAISLNWRLYRSFVGQFAFYYIHFPEWTILFDLVGYIILVVGLFQVRLADLRGSISFNKIICGTIVLFNPCN